MFWFVFYLYSSNMKKMPNISYVSGFLSCAYYSGGLFLVTEGKNFFPYSAHVFPGLMGSYWALENVNILADSSALEKRCQWLSLELFIYAFFQLSSRSVKRMQRSKSGSIDTLLPCLPDLSLPIQSKLKVDSW